MDLFTPENLFDHIQTVKRWINSCETSEQITLLQAFIDSFLLEGYLKAINDPKGKDVKVFRYDIETSFHELSECIDARKLVLASG